MARGAALYGSRPSDYIKDTELKDAEYIVGTLFIRVGGLQIDTLKWNWAFPLESSRKAKKADGEATNWNCIGLA